MRQPSVMTHSFSNVPHADIPRSSFDRSHGYKTTFDAGYLIPIFADEALPGDTFNVNLTAFCRLSTPVYPIMDNVKLTTFFFAVPYRLIWNNFKKFMGEQDNPGDSTDYLVPTVAAPVAGFPEDGLFDYLGIPPKVNGLVVNALHTRAYNLIYNEWFRDENLQNSVVVDKDDGPDTYTDYVLLRRGKRHDYFTSCLPWPQKGTEVTLPLGTSAPIRWDAFADASGIDNDYVIFQGGTADDAMGHTTYGTKSGAVGLAAGDDANMIADLASATAATVNQLREAFQTQKLYERDARGGTRYTELVRSHFGVTSPDARLQRPEYLGGGSTFINITQVPQTSQTATTPQGTLAAYATGVANNHGFTKSFTEHCVLLGLVHVGADLTYQQGLDRMWSRQTRLEHYWPALAHLGEQAVLVKEIYAQGPTVDTDVDGTPNDDEVFGYQERWAEYRYKPSRITGQFRSGHTTTLDGWHLSQEFGSEPALNTAFIQDTPPLDRVLATGPHVLFDAHFSMRCARPMPTYSVPGLIDHF